MRILCIGDMHIKVDNIAQIDLAESQICTILQEQRVDLIVVLGDVLHTHERLHTLAVNRAYKFFEAIVRFAPLYILVGNHDYIQNDQFLTQHHWMNALKEWRNITIVDTVIMEHSLVFVPYVPNGRFIDALQTIGDSWTTASCIFTHQEFEGAQMRNGITSVNGDGWSLSYPKVISGHIHGRQTLESGVHYTGALLPSSGSKQSTLSLFHVRTQQITDIPLYFPKKQCIMGISIKELEGLPIDATVDRIHLHDEYDAFTIFRKSSLYAQLAERGIKVSFKPVLEDEKCAPNSPVQAQCFEKILYDIVLERADEYLYSALENVYHGREVNEEDILIIPISHSS